MGTVSVPARVPPPGFELMDSVTAVVATSGVLLPKASVIRTEAANCLMASTGEDTPIMSLLAAAGSTAKRELGALVNVGETIATATRAYTSALSIDKSGKVATPLTALTVVVPESTCKPVDVAMETASADDVRMLPAAS